MTFQTKAVSPSECRQWELLHLQHSASRTRNPAFRTGMGGNGDILIVSGTFSDLA